MTKTLALETNLTLGLDVSKYQGLWDAQAAYDAGARFTFIKASGADKRSGLPFTDYRFERNAQVALDAGLLISFYHFLRPEFDVVAQARYFCATTKEVQRHFSLVADVERHADMSQIELGKRVELFVNEIEVHTGQKAIIYTRGVFWNSYLGKTAWASEHPLWVAIWTTRWESPWSGLRSWYRPWPWDTWTFWQRSGDGNGRGSEFGAQSRDIDIDYFNGTLEELNALSDRMMGVEKPAPPPRPAPVEVPPDALERLWRYAIREGWEV